MTTKLSRDNLLREMLNTLVKGWGPKAVYQALDEVVATAVEKSGNHRSPRAADTEPSAVQFVEDLPIGGERRTLLIQFARDFDAGTAFPKVADVRAFLASHHRAAKDLRTRGQAFRKMIPLLADMSEKGLTKIISRSQHSGPAELEAISDAIKGAGESLRGRTSDRGVGSNE